MSLATWFPEKNSGNFSSPATHISYIPDMNSQKAIGSCIVWTNEKHVDYLNSMEASFVRTMFENNGRLLHLRLDRYLPDSSDSTLDLNLQRRRKRTTPVNVLNQRSTTNDNKTRRRLPYQKCISKRDQVVPQFDQFRRCDEDESDYHSDVPVAPAK